METTLKKIDRVKVWKESFQTIIKSKEGFKKRLNELKTWDKPLNPKDKDPNFKWAEWARKVQALEELISE
jgi:hypothetical protein